jgi:hypothetical protein
MTKADHDKLGELGFKLLEEAIDELFWQYSYTGQSRELIVSWSLAEGSFQTTVKEGGDVLIRVCSEGLSECHTSSDGIEAVFAFGNYRSSCRICIKPRLSVEWGTIRE